MLLYDGEAERSSAEIDCLNQALAKGQYCVYATIDANDPDFERMLSRKIINYERHTNEGNFTLVNFKPFYDSAANGQLTLFKQLKAKVEATLRNRIAAGKSGKALLFADAACNLSRHRQFDECVTLEGWWQDTYSEWMAKNLDVTIICAHPSSILKQQSLLNEQSRVSHVHSLTLDLNDFMEKTKKPSSETTARTIRILIAEPEADIRTMYKQYLNALPMEVVSVDSGEKCLEQTNGFVTNGGYDIMIIDTHIKDLDGLELVKKITEKNKEQSVVITSTWDSDTVRSSLVAHLLDVEKYPILHKPFRFSQLLGLIKPESTRLS
jgi:CheY-like chemotaxis protein